MRNSLFPAILLAATVAAALWLIRPQAGEERGRGGPAVYPGIDQTPVKEKNLVPSAKLAGALTTHGGTAPAGSADWSVVVVAGEDDHALTRTLLKALGEELTRSGRIAILDPKQHTPDEPLPVASDGCLRIAVTAPPAAFDQPAAITATWTITAIPTRLPADHPAARWLPVQPESAPTTITITHRSAPDGPAAWPEWYAAIGRAAADELLATLAMSKPGDASARAAADAQAATRIRLTAWTTPGAIGPDGKPLTPYGRIPSPPQADLLEHAVAFQEPFVRGWIGRLSPVPVVRHDGSALSTRDELSRRLERGKWTPQPQPDGSLLYTIDDVNDGVPTVHRAISVRGDLFIEWQERPKPVELWQAWQAAAKAGDAEAKEQLARHRDTPGIPDELRRP